MSSLTTPGQLFLLGRTLVKIEEEALPELPPGADTHRVGTRAALVVLSDLLGHPDTSVSAIAVRAGLPRSQVSGAVARLEGRFDRHRARSCRRQKAVDPQGTRRVRRGPVTPHDVPYRSVTLDVTLTGSGRRIAPSTIDGHHRTTCPVPASGAGTGARTELR